MAEYVELFIDQGTDFSAFINLNDDDTNLPQNVQGYVVTGHLRRSVISSTISETLYCEVSDPVEGELYISLGAANTANLKPGNYFYDVKVIDTNSSNAVSRLIEGIIVVNPSITK